MTTKKTTDGLASYEVFVAADPNFQLLSRIMVSELPEDLQFDIYERSSNKDRPYQISEFPFRKNELMIVVPSHIHGNLLGNNTRDVILVPTNFDHDYIKRMLIGGYHRNDFPEIEQNVNGVVNPAQLKINGLEGLV